MACFSPLKGYYSRKRNKDTGKRSVLFGKNGSWLDVPVMIPCGKCEGCLLARSYEWSIRCICEGYNHKESYFLTLTYDNEHLPDGGNLVRSHFQSFMKRLRRKFEGYKIKVFYCGEYGERRGRPHYHAIIFGLPLNELGIKYYFRDVSKRGQKNYNCPFLDKIWQQGEVVLGMVTRQSCAYVAQYTLKKNKARWMQSYGDRVKPFVGASTRNAIGFDFFFKYFRDIFRRGFFTLEGMTDKNGHPTLIKPIRYFKRMLEKHYPIDYIKYVRRPRQRAIHEQKMKIIRDLMNSTTKFADELDKRLRERYIREKKILRQLTPRLDF